MSPSEPPAVAPRFGPLVFVLASVTALGPLSIDMYLPALPSMGQDLHASAGSVQMTMAVYMLGIGLGQLVFGPLSDRFGRRRPAIAGLIIYAIASASCALATDIHWLIGLRFAQALGVCCGQVIVRAILADLFEARELARFSALISMVQGFAPIVAPLVGGLVFITLGWRAIFWVLAAYALIALFAVRMKLPETRSEEAMRQSIAETPWSSYRAVLTNRPLIGMALVAAFGTCAFSIYLANAPQLIIHHFGVPAGLFAFYFGANSLGLMGAAYLNRWMLKRLHGGQVLAFSTAGLVIVATTLLVIVQNPAAGKWLVLAPIFLLVASYALVTPNAIALAQAADRSRGGAVAAVVGCLQWTISGSAVAICGLFNDGTLRPMAIMMVIGGAMALLSFTANRRRVEVIAAR